MDESIVKRICLKFCIANGISCAESLKMLEKAYGESSLSKTRAYEWYSAFKNGRDIVEDLPRSGRTSTSLTAVNIAKVKEMVTENLYLSLRDIAAELSVFHESIRTILNHRIPLIWLQPTFSLSKIQITTSRQPFSVDRRHKKELRQELKSIPENTFKKCFDDWIIRWRKCIISERAYFEGNKINLNE